MSVARVKATEQTVETLGRLRKVVPDWRSSLALVRQFAEDPCGLSHHQIRTKPGSYWTCVLCGQVYEGEDLPASCKCMSRRFARTEHNVYYLAPPTRHNDHLPSQMLRFYIGWRSWIKWATDARVLHIAEGVVSGKSIRRASAEVDCSHTFGVRALKALEAAYEAGPIGEDGP